MPYDETQGPLVGDEPKPGFFGGLLNTLYPAGQFGDMIDPQMLRQEQNLALRRSGLSLLASSGPQPRGTRNFGADLARALDPDPWQTRLANVAQMSASIGQMQRKAQKEQQAQQILSQFPAKPGETDKDRDARLAALSDAFQSAGLMEEAKQAADLRVSLRRPPIGVHGNQFYDTRDGTILGSFPTELQTPDGSQLYSTAISRLGVYDKVRADVEQYNLYRSMPLTAATTAGLVEAAQNLMNTSKGLAEAQGGEGAIGHLPVLGELAKLLQALQGHTESMTEADRQKLLKAVDPLIDSVLSPRHQRELSSIRNIFAEKWGPEGADRMMRFLPPSPAFNASGVILTPGAQRVQDWLKDHPNE